MLKVNCEIKGLKELNAKIEYIKQLSQMKTDKEFQKFIQDKVLKVVEKVSRERLVGKTTNEEDIEEYIKNHKIRNEDNGFVLYNDYKIPADKYNILPFDTRGYPDGMFNLAIAFEYGVGIIDTSGITRSKSHKRLGNEWYLPKNVNGASGILTQGYEGQGIYKYTRIEVEDNLPKWVEEYFDGGESKWLINMKKFMQDSKTT